MNNQSCPLDKKQKKNMTDQDVQAIVNLTGVKADQPQEILQGISHFYKPEDAIDFADNQIKRYSTMSFSTAWFFEEVKRLALACMSCPNFSGQHGSCEKLMKNGCQLHSERAFYNQKTTAQKVAEELGIPHMSV